MDRTTAANYVTNAGKRQFTDGPPGTTITGAHMTAVQEEILAVIEGAGIAPDPNTLTQLRAAILATVSAGGFFSVPAIGLSIGSGGEGAWVSGGNSTMEGEHHFTDFTLQSAHQLSVGSTGILIIRCTGTATINGSINGNGNAGGTGSAVGGSGGEGAGGGGGGGGGYATNNGGSGGGIYSAGATGGASGGTTGSGKTNPLLLILHHGIAGGSGGSAYGVAGTASPGGSLFSINEWAVCSLLNNGVLLTGAGGGGGGGIGVAGGGEGAGGGGGGGGCFILIVANTINGTGFVSANGGDGGLAYPNPGGGSGGGGGGGGVCLTVSKNTHSLTLLASGGIAGAGSNGNGHNGANGFAKAYHL